MRKLRFKKIKINWGQFFNYIILILLSSGILLTFLIALPLTEKLSQIVAFDLNVVENFWSKEYLLELESEKTSDIRKTKDILFKRLNSYGVEEVSITNNENLIKVIVKTTEPQTYVDELIKNQYNFSIVTRKNDVDFDSEENQLAQYLEENYEETEFNSKTFRNIHVTELPSSSGEKSYFAIAKPWLHKSTAFKDFLKEYDGEYVGVNIDGFVSPVLIPEPTIFAIPLSTEKERIEAIDILYNSGTIPTKYEIKKQNPIDVQQINIDYIEITVAFFLSIVAMYLYTYFTGIYNKDVILRTLFGTLLSLALYLSFLKISLLPVHLFLLVIESVLIIMLSNLIQQNSESKNSIAITAFVVGLIFNFLGIGYLKILGGHLIILSSICYLATVISNLYINKVSEYFKR